MFELADHRSCADIYESEKAVIVSKEVTSAVMASKLVTSEKAVMVSKEVTSENEVMASTQVTSESVLMTANEQS